MTLRPIPPSFSAEAKPERLIDQVPGSARQGSVGNSPETPVTGAEVLRRALVRAGVEVIFGHPGGAILPFYDALHTGKRPTHVLMRHEQGAAHAADGYARATGQVGVCLATSGPGATNLVTGLATSMADSVAVVAITGQVPSRALGTEAFQETDVVGVTMPITKHGFAVQRAEDLPQVVEEAFRLARSGRPGPVVIDVPKDIQMATVDARLVAESADLGLATKVSDLTASLSATQLGRLQMVAELIRAASRPVIMAGRGIVLSETRDLLVSLSEKADLPVVTTLLGLDGFPATHRCALGMPGMHGTERANRGIQRADLIIGLGLRFDDRVTGKVDGFAPEAKIVHFDVDPAVVSRCVHADYPVIGDLRETLPIVADLVHPETRSAWWSELEGWKRASAPEALPTPSDQSGSTPLMARAAIRRLARWIGSRGGVVATDVGQHQMWFAQEVKEAEPRTHLTSGGLGTMGYALPAALGAAVGASRIGRGQEVWAVTGDGGFQMTLQELATLTQEGLPVRTAVINNASLGMVRQWQDMLYGGRHSASILSGPDFVLLANAFGIPAFRVASEEDLDQALWRSTTISGPLLIDVRVPPDEDVFPIVPPGAALHELVLEQPS